NFEYPDFPIRIPGNLRGHVPKVFGKGRVSNFEFRIPASWPFPALLSLVAPPRLRWLTPRPCGVTNLHSVSGLDSSTPGRGRGELCPQSWLPTTTATSKRWSGLP